MNYPDERDRRESEQKRGGIPSFHPPPVMNDMSHIFWDNQLKN
jgi:hypothetical protein